MSLWIARSDFIAIGADGGESRVRVALQAPVPTAHGDWACVVDADPLLLPPSKGFVGEDSIQALALALTYVHARLEDFCRSGGRIAFDDEARTDVPLDAQFGRPIAASVATPPASYDDGYPSCAETYATLRIFSDELSPDEISRALGIKPTTSFHKGEPISPRVQRPRPQHGWLLCSRGCLDSRDTRRHIDWLLDEIWPVAAEFARITNGGRQADIYSFWVSARGQGGPILSATQMRRLSFLGLECSYDVYFGGDDEASAG